MFSFGDYYFCRIRHFTSAFFRNAILYLRRLIRVTVWSKYGTCGLEVSALCFVVYHFSLLISKNPTQLSGPYQHDTRKPNSIFKPDHLQMYFSPRFNSRRRFLGEASFRKSACQFLEALRLVSSLFFKFLSTHRVNVHRQWA